MLFRGTITVDFVAGERELVNFENEEKWEFIAKEQSGHQWTKITERKHQR